MPALSPAHQAYLAALHATLSEDAAPQVAIATNPLATTTDTTRAIPLEHLGLIRVEGEDAAGFLHNLMSNDIKKLPVHGAHHNSFNSPKGRMLASFLVWRDETGFMLQLSADLLAAIHKKLSMYVLRAKVKLSLPGENLFCLGLVGPGLEQALAAVGASLPAADLSVAPGEIATLRLSAQRAQLLIPAERAETVATALLAAGVQAAGTDAWRREDIRAGIPLITAATQDEFVAQMVNFELIGGVNFQKGCYPGQEIVARTQYLGKLKKRMFFAHLDAPEAPQSGSDVFAPEFGAQSCGKVLSVALAAEGGYELLVVTQLAAHEAGEVHVGSPSGPQLRFGALPYTVE